MKKSILVLLTLILLISFASLVAAEEFSEEIIIAPAEPWIPVALEAGGSLGQTFIANQSFDAVVLNAPTWNTSDSGFTFKLYQGSKDGTVVHTEQIANAVDGSSLIQFAAQPAGTYYLEMSEPVGQIGWWTREGNVYADGEAFVNGEAVNDHDRPFVTRLYGAATGSVESAPADAGTAAEQPTDNPKTGDRGLAWFTLLALASAAGLAWLTARQRAREQG